MAFNSKFPPRLVVARGLDNSEPGCAIYFYTAATDTATVVGGAGYFPDGVRFGMGLGDMLFVWDQINKVVVAFVILSFTGTSPNFELFSSSSLGTVPRYVVGATDTISTSDFGGTVAWLRAAGGIQSLIAGPSGRTVDVTFVDQQPLSGSNAVSFAGVGCTINGSGTNTGLVSPRMAVTLRWDGNSNWFVASDGDAGGSGGASSSTYQPMNSGTTATVASANTTLDIKSAATAVKNITIPAAAAGNVGQNIVIKDTIGTAATYNQVITPVSGTIDGASSVSITANKNSLTLCSDGVSNWMLV